MALISIWHLAASSLQYPRCHLVQIADSPGDYVKYSAGDRDGFEYYVYCDSPQSTVFLALEIGYKVRVVLLRRDERRLLFE